MIQLPVTYLLKSENLHFAACDKSPLSEVPTALKGPHKYIFLLLADS